MSLLESLTGFQPTKAETESPRMQPSRFTSCEADMLAASTTLTSLHRYTSARRQFLATMGCETSCRDPLAEFSERIVAELLKATAASSRVQRGYDLVCPRGNRIQVKYLANPCVDRWINEHHLVFTAEMDQYALVIFEHFELSAVLLFERTSLGRVCQLIGKRHPNQEHTLQLTRQNYRMLVDRQEEFSSLGVVVWRPSSAMPEISE